MFVKSPKGLIIKVEKFPVVSDFPKCLMVCEPRLCDWGQSSLHPIKHHPPPTTRSGTALTSKLSVGPVKGPLYAGSSQGNSYGGSQ